MKKLFAALLLALALGATNTACTDAEMAGLSAYGEAGEIKCYSGGAVIFEGRSTGKIHSESQSDGWYFKDAATGKLIRTNADCVVTN